MKKNYVLIVILFAFAFIGKSQTVVFQDDLESYTVGAKLAQSAQAAGNMFWTTWSQTIGGAEDAVIATKGTKAAHFTYGNDQVLLLGDKTSSHYELTFDIYVPANKNGYFNMLHSFSGSSSEWGLEVQINNPANNYSISAGGANAATFAFTHDAWVPVKLDVDLDADLAKLFINNVKVHEWQFSLQATGGAGQRKLAAVDFYPPKDAGTSEFYVDNVVFTQVGSDTYPVFEIPTTPITADLEVGETSNSTLTLNNTGTSIGEYASWITFDDAANGTGNVQNLDLTYNTSNIAGAIGYNTTEPLQVEYAAKYTLNKYKNMVGTSIKTVMFYAYQKVKDDKYTIRIYGSGYFTAPGAILSEKTIINSDTSNWVSVTLDTPVLLDGQDLWVAIELEQLPGNYNMSYCEEPIDPNGDWSRTRGGAWSRLQIENPSLAKGNWAIVALCEGKTVPGSWLSITNTPYGSITAGQSGDVKLKFNATGLTVNNTYKAKLNIITNDTDNPTFEIPCILNVVEGVGTVDLDVANNLYPNPASDFVYLNVNPKKVNSYQVVDMRGKTVIPTTLFENGKTEINVSNLAKGLYLIRTNDGVIYKLSVVR